MMKLSFLLSIYNMPVCLLLNLSSMGQRGTTVLWAFFYIYTRVESSSVLIGHSVYFYDEKLTHSIKYKTLRKKRENVSKAVKHFQ